MTKNAEVQSESTPEASAETVLMIAISDAIKCVQGEIQKTMNIEDRMTSIIVENNTTKVFNRNFKEGDEMVNVQDLEASLPQIIVQIFIKIRRGIIKFMEEEFAPLYALHSTGLFKTPSLHIEEPDMPDENHPTIQCIVESSISRLKEVSLQQAETEA